MTNKTMTLEPCKECGSNETSWSCAPKNNGQAVDGRVCMREVSMQFYRGCDFCGETLEVIGADEFLAKLNRHLSQPADRGEAVAWMVPSIVSFKGVMRTNCPPEMQAQIEGTVAWHPEMIGDSHPVTDRYGVTHKPRPLVYGDTAPPPAAGVPDAFAPIPDCTRAPTHELWDAYQAFNYAYRGMNTQQALRAAINGVLANRARIYAELSAAPSPEANPHG